LSGKRKVQNSRPLVGIALDGAMGHGRAIMRGVMRYANARRCWLLHEELRVGFIEDLPWPRCAGAIYAAASPSLARHINARSRHVIVCSGSGDPAMTPVVCADDEAVGRMAAAHLLDCRLEHFGFCGRRGERVSNARLSGFADALSARGFTCEQSPVSWPTEYEWVKKRHWPALQKWLLGLPKPVGIFAWDDMTAHDLAAACFDINLGVPEQIAIIGVNNDDLLCDSAWPPLSSVEVDYGRVGYIAAEQLDRLINGEKLPKDLRVIRVPPKGVAFRQSTDVLAVDDHYLALAIRYIREHACDPCNVQDVIRKVPVGRRWLERHFVEKLGRTPHDEIVRVRLDRARRMLQNPEETMLHVAEACGFGTTPNMTRTFKQVLGSTPGAFRRRHLWTLRATVQR
jgi:LacI family transcriptional regulator